MKEHDCFAPTPIAPGKADREGDPTARLEDVSVSGCLAKPLDPEDPLKTIAALAAN